MRARVATRVAWSLWLATLGLVAGGLALTFLNGFSHQDPFFAVVLPSLSVTYASVGALIASRQPENRIGWLLLFMAGSFAVGNLGDQYAVRGLVTAPGSLPGPTLAAWAKSWVFVLGIAPLSLLFLLFPDGNPPSRRWRGLVRVAVVGAVLVLAGILADPKKLALAKVSGRVLRIANPTGI